MLNRSKGPAVRGPRAQADRKLYARAVRGAARRRSPASTCARPRSRICWSRLAGSPGSSTGPATELRAGAVVLTTGTFLRGEIHLGEERWPAGRVGDAPAVRPGREPAAPRPAPGPAEDRHAAAARRADDRLAGLADPAGRRSAGAVLVPDRAPAQPADRLPDHPDQRRDARADPRQPASLADVFGPDRGDGRALLPVDRGQGGALRRSRAAPDLPRAGRARRRHGLSERHLDLAAARRAGRADRDHPRARARRDAAAGLCDRVRPRRSARARPDPGAAQPARPVPRRPDQRHDRLRGGGGAGPGRRHQRGAGRRAAAGRISCSTGPTPISAC